MTETSFRLNANSRVPLYYQLYEVIKEEIDSGRWTPGGRMPSEPDLVHSFNVSRIVVRQALEILADDGQVLRIKGRGTFVAPAKLRHPVGALSRSLTTPRHEDVDIKILDKRIDQVPRSISAGLSVHEAADVVRVTSRLSVRFTPLAIMYSYFAAEHGTRISEVSTPGQSMPSGFTLSDLGIELARTTADIEVSEACKFEADQLGIAPRSTVLVAMCTEFRRAEGSLQPLERARVIYRGEAAVLSTCC